jgi:outer membrane immunogenic protein
MKRSLLALIAATVLATTHAFAADLWAPPPMPYKAPPPVAPAWGWTGFYLGADVGAAWATDTVSPTVADGGTFPRSNKLATSGPLGGATIGFNYQLSSFLLGIEGDLGALAIANSKADLGGSTEVDFINNGWYGDATGRLGFVWGPALLYGKGGWAYFNGQGSTTTAIPGFTATQTGAFTGWTYGGGLEYRLGGPWSAKIEYLHFAFGTKDASLTSGAGVFPYANALSVDTVKFGLNYQFGLGPVAPYLPSGPIFTRD